MFGFIKKMFETRKQPYIYHFYNKNINSLGTEVTNVVVSAYSDDEAWSKVRNITHFHHELKMHRYQNIEDFSIYSYEHVPVSTYNAPMGGMGVTF